MKLKYRKDIWATLISFMMAFALVGCGSDSSSSSSSGPVARYLTGTAATGMPLVDGTVDVIGFDIDSSTDATADASADIGVDGKFSVNVTALKPPYILRAMGKTADDATAEMFSVATRHGVANITPLTHLLTWNVTKTDPTMAFKGWNINVTTDVNDATIDKKHGELRTRLAPIMTALGLTPGNINMLTTTFNANHTGMDALLDILDISADAGGIVTITNGLTGYDITVDATGDMTGDTSFDASRMTGWLYTADVPSAVAISTFWAEINMLYKTSEADATNTILPKLAQDFLTEGRDATTEMAQWDSTGDGPGAGILFKATILRGMTPATELPTAYDKGYWINLHIKMGDMSMDELTAMVHDDATTASSKWFWYGDQNWISMNISPQAEMTTDASTGVFDYKSKLSFDLGDKRDYARDRDATVAIITGPGLPTEGILMHNASGDRYFKIYGEYDNAYMLGNDASVTTILADPEYPEYTVRLCDNTSGSSCMLDGVLDDNHSYKVKVSGSLFLPDTGLIDNSNDIFPTLTDPTSGTVAAANVSVLDLTGDAGTKKLQIKWINPAGFTPRWVGLSWDGTHDTNEEDMSSDTTSVELESTTDTNIKHGKIQIRGSDASDRRIGVEWYFSQ